LSGSVLTLIDTRLILVAGAGRRLGRVAHGGVAPPAGEVDAESRGVSTGTSEQTLFLLKTGPQTAQQLAVLLDITSMGARRQLEAALEKGLVAHEDVADKVGRPSRRWQLTPGGHARFPDRHADLTVELIAQVQACSATRASTIDRRARAQQRSWRQAGRSRLIWRKEVDSLARARWRRLHGPCRAAGRWQRAAGGKPLPHLRGSHGMPEFLPFGTGHLPAGTGRRLHGGAQRVSAGGGRCVYRVVRYWNPNKGPIGRGCFC
jgi:hypothetical protein